MILKYNHKFENEDKTNYRNFIGYITPEGEPLDYSYPLGLGGHDRNYVTDFFLKYFYYDEKEDFGRCISGEYLTADNYKNAFRIHCLEELKKECSDIVWRFENNYSVSPRDLLKYRLRNVFFNAYQNEDFFKGFGRSLTLVSEDTFEDIHLKENENNERFQNLTFQEQQEEMQSQYGYYWSRVLLSYFKDTLIQYLGYDSVETMTSRTIVTSYPNIHERFYNYLLLDFQIIQVARMFWDEKEKMYKPILFVVETEKEENLKKEIEAIKKLVRRDERLKYFRD